MQFKRIAIVGVGLIGGSFALAARRAGIADCITGFDSPEILREAVTRGLIDGIERQFESQESSDADLVYLAAPVGAILSFLRTRGRLLKPGAIVTDSGSTKREICRAAREALPSEVHFVGGHPMAGSEKTGLDHASGDLFRHSPYALVVEEHVNASALSAVKRIVSEIGARPIEFTADQHDRIVARVSHAPQMLATAFALAVARNGTEGLPAAGNGFADMTRLAESRWSVWEDICRTNAGEISSALDETISEMEAVRVALSTGDLAGLNEMFQIANELVRRFHDVKGNS
ncbi:MAG TPA: prephenate dehydrogenase/arogenate dehydrogenase family protein [Blastocatellia bacterium]|nr:prephenate dehydrogenase/arogenate dehydrogenase family protein [Blastocatellia bacterium]